MSEIRLLIDDNEKEKIAVLKKHHKISKNTAMIKFLITKAYSEIKEVVQ